MISTVIPIYKNTGKFLALFKHNFPLLKNTQLIIVNDSPTEKPEPQILKIAPQALVINNPKNLGFAKSMNIGVKKAQGDYLLFLNSDVKLLDNKFNQAIAEFKNNPRLFALTFAQIEANGHLTGANQGSFYQGLFQHQERTSQSVSLNLWPEGGSSLLRKKYFLKLKGFDEDYSPFYWEDVDLGFRAQKKGWQTWFYPKIKVKHQHQTTIGQYYSQTKIKTIAFRNQLLFIWKNLSFGQQFQHWCLLPLILLKNRNKPEYFNGFRQALIIRFKW